MIMLGRKKVGSIAASINEKMNGKGYSDEDLKYNPEKSKSEDQDVSAQALSHAASSVLESLKANDVSRLEQALQDFIEICTKK